MKDTLVLGRMPKPPRYRSGNRIGGANVLFVDGRRRYKSGGRSPTCWAYRVSCAICGAETELLQVQLADIERGKRLFRCSACAERTGTALTPHEALRLWSTPPSVIASARS